MRKVRLSGSTIDIYLDNDDFLIFLEVFEAIGPHLFTEITSQINQLNNQSSESIILESGLVSKSSPIQTARYLISEADYELKSRGIKLKDGSGVKTVIDQNYNPDSVEILMGGVADETVIVATTLRTTGETKVAKELFKKLKKSIAEKSTKAGTNNFLLPGALSKLNAGWRLTPCLEYSESLDINLN